MALQRYSAGGGSYASRGGSGDKQANKKSYRVSSPTERLPDGLPTWFEKNDADEDGQISMAEFATSWTDQIASEFVKLDANGDGMIVPEEAAPHK